MARPGHLLLAVLLAALCGCAQANLPSLSPPASAPKAEPAAGPASAPGLQPLETQTVVPGTPTDVYVVVARAALNCWFGAGGPLKPTHVFLAEAAPPSSGGGAEIVLIERDPALADQRGPRAFRVSFAASPTGVTVGTLATKMAAPMADVMVRDVEVWASGGTGCQLRVLMPPKAVAPAAPPSKRKAYSR